MCAILGVELIITGLSESSVQCRIWESAMIVLEILLKLKRWCMADLK